ncbi:hypothetical protein RF11_06555 [Thelohanellus kitauei]|uniref:Uncharacterized protein n=1 Tax=Thelohanellus kitauei TaxID=669202 RepID=A0A0C2M882_THEKT|nr:hypothetical protein RF11_06555 [Thelohanellus kitauei]
MTKKSLQNENQESNTVLKVEPKLSMRKIFRSFSKTSRPQSVIPARTSPKTSPPDICFHVYRIITDPFTDDYFNLYRGILQFKSDGVILSYEIFKNEPKYECWKYEQIKCVGTSDNTFSMQIRNKVPDKKPKILIYYLTMNKEYKVLESFLDITKNLSFAKNEKAGIRFRVTVNKNNVVGNFIYVYNPAFREERISKKKLVKLEESNEHHPEAPSDDININKTQISCQSTCNRRGIVTKSIIETISFYQDSLSFKNTVQINNTKRRIENTNYAQQNLNWTKPKNVVLEG